MVLRPALCPGLLVVEGRRRAVPGIGVVKCGLLVYGHRKLYWCYTAACFENKEHFQGGVEASLLELREWQYLFFLVSD